ncbi:MAG: biopolymer transporter ExbD [Candidatus Aegiribacteria sp.]|nr:biopolymer transporter ExbD [Candidatus Aegiribacteria sp.]
MIKTRYKQFSAINVTNLVDVTLVLLVIFMLTSPVMQRSADVLPPSSNEGRILNNLDPSESLVIEIDAYGNLSVSGETVLMENLRPLAEAAFSSGRSEAFVRADRDVRYEIVANALTKLGSGGYLSVGLIQESMGNSSEIH